MKPQPRSAFVQCAGHACEERDACLRYAKRGGKTWASFDVERMKFNDCHAIIPIKKGN